MTALFVHVLPDLIQVALKLLVLSRFDLQAVAAELLEKLLRMEGVEEHGVGSFLSLFELLLQPAVYAF